MSKKLVAGFIAISAMCAAAQTAPTGHPSLSAPGGRYVFGQVSDYQRDKYMLDTQTGRLWNVVCIGPAKDGQCPRGLEPVPFLDTNGNSSLTPPSPSR